MRKLRGIVVGGSLAIGLGFFVAQVAAQGGDECRQGCAQEAADRIRGCADLEDKEADGCREKARRVLQACMSLCPN